MLLDNLRMDAMDLYYIIKIANPILYWYLILVQVFYESHRVTSRIARQLIDE